MCAHRGAPRNRASSRRPASPAGRGAAPKGCTPEEAAQLSARRRAAPLAAATSWRLMTGRQSASVWASPPRREGGVLASRPRAAWSARVRKTWKDSQAACLSSSSQTGKSLAAFRAAWSARAARGSVDEVYFVLAILVVKTKRRRGGRRWTGICRCEATSRARRSSPRPSSRELLHQSRSLPDLQSPLGATARHCV